MYQYAHGGNAHFEPNGKNKLDLSANINPLSFPESVERAINSELKFLNRYPDSYNTELRKKIADHENISMDWIFCGNGASDIIFRIPIALRLKRAVILAPTFSDYERALKSCGTEVVYHSLKKEYGFRVDSTLIDTLNQHNADLIFLCNPNNPTGVLTESGILEELLVYCKARNVTVVVDECFIDFVLQSEKYTAKKFLFQYENLIILKAFTKIFALPGIRLGYALCNNSDIIRNLYANGADWTVSNLAQGAGIAVLESAVEYIRQTVSYVEVERKVLQSGLIRLGFEVFDSKANFIFFHNPHDIDLYKELDNRNIRIRSCSNYNGLSDNFYRTAVSNTENNQKLITTLEEILLWQKH